MHRSKVAIKKCNVKSIYVSLHFIMDVKVRALICSSDIMIFSFGDFEQTLSFHILEGLGLQREILDILNIRDEKVEHATVNASIACMA